MRLFMRPINEVLSRAAEGSILRDRIAAEGLRPEPKKKHCCNVCSPAGLLALGSRHKLALLILPLAILTILQLPTPALAYGDQIMKAGLELSTWVRRLGAIVMVLGLAGVGIKLMVTHDREGLTPLFYVVLGGLVMMLSSSIVDLIQGVAGGAGAI